MCTRTKPFGRQEHVEGMLQIINTSLCHIKLSNPSLSEQGIPKESPEISLTQLAVVWIAQPPLRPTVKLPLREVLEPRLHRGGIAVATTYHAIIIIPALRMCLTLTHHPDCEACTANCLSLYPSAVAHLPIDYDE